MIWAIVPADLECPSFFTKSTKSAFKGIPKGKCGDRIERSAIVAILKIHLEISIDLESRLKLALKGI